MKKLLFYLILISIFSCSSSNDSINRDVDSSNDNCYNVIMVGTSTVWAQCDSGLVFGVVRHSDFMEGGPFPQSKIIYVCVTKSGYTMNDFNLGQLICDYSIYK